MVRLSRDSESSVLISLQLERVMVEWRMMGGRPSLSETRAQGTASWAGSSVAGLEGSEKT